MTDRELLELAAKAAGYALLEHEGPYSAWVAPIGAPLDKDGEPIGFFLWRPMLDDGDALRLAIALELCLDLARPSCYANYFFDRDNCIYKQCIEQFADDPYAATRRAIVRAAAEIGKGIP